MKLHKIINKEISNNTSSGISLNLEESEMNGKVPKTTRFQHKHEDRIKNPDVKMSLAYKCTNQKSSDIGLCHWTFGLYICTFVHFFCSLEF